MASIAFVVTLSNGMQITKTATVQDEEIGRLIAWAQYRFEPDRDTAGNPLPIDGAQAVSKWISHTVQDTFKRIEDYEKDLALKRAIEEIVPITVDIK